MKRAAIMSWKDTIHYCTDMNGRRRMTAKYKVVITAGVAQVILESVCVLHVHVAMKQVYMVSDHW